jgi:hypothetical protein
MMNWLTDDGSLRTDPQASTGNAARPISRHLVVAFLWTQLAVVIAFTYPAAAPRVPGWVVGVIVGLGVVLLQLSLARWYYTRDSMSVQVRGYYRLAIGGMGLLGLTGYASLALGPILFGASFFGKHSGR